MKLSEKVKTLLFAGVLVVAGVGLAALPAFAANTPSSVSNGLNAAVNGSGLSNKSVSVDSVAKNVVNALLYIIGILAVIMIIVGGVMYTTSAGDQAKVTKAKNIIIYGLVGLVIAILAYAIVSFVLDKILV